MVRKARNTTLRLHTQRLNNQKGNEDRVEGRDAEFDKARDMARWRAERATASSPIKTSMYVMSRNPYFWCYHPQVNTQCGQIPLLDSLVSIPKYKHFYKQF